MTSSDADLHGWNDMEEAYNEGFRDAAQELFRKLVQDAEIRDDGWNGGNVVSVVDTWLQSYGVDTHVPEDDDELDKEDEDEE